MTRRNRSHLWAFIAVVLVLRADATGWAEPETGELERAKALYRAAESRFSLGDFRAALELYSRAFAQKDLPGFLFNIGQCHFNLGEYQKALFFYDRYLSRQPKAGNRAIVEQLVERAKAELEAQRAREAAKAAASEAPPALQQPRAPSTPRGEPARPGDTRMRSILFWSGVALTGALVAAGATTGALVLDRRADYLDSSTPLERQRELASSGRQLRLATNVLFGLAGAAAVSTVLYRWLSRPAARSATTSASGTTRSASALRFAVGPGQVHLLGGF